MAGIHDYSPPPPQCLISGPPYIHCFSNTPFVSHSSNSAPPCQGIPTPTGPPILFQAFQKIRDTPINFSVHTESASCAHCVCAVCAHGVRSAYTVCTQCAQCAHSVCTVCTRCAQSVNTGYTQCAHKVHTGCTQGAHKVPTKYPQSAPKVHPRCLLRCPPRYTQGAPNVSLK